MHNAFLQRCSFFTQSIITADEQHTVTGSDTKQRDETNDGWNTNLARSDHQCKYPTNQCQRQVEQDHPTLSCILELGIDQEEDDHNTHQRSQKQCTTRCFFALELTSELHMIAFRQFHLGIDALTDIVHHPTKVASACVGRNHDLALHILTTYAIRTHSRNHISYIAQWDAFASWSINHQVVHLVCFIAYIILGTHDKVKHLALFIDLRYHSTCQIHFYELCKFRHGHAILRHHLTLRNDL